jgi:hypothetical protein
MNTNFEFVVVFLMLPLAVMGLFVCAQRYLMQYFGFFLILLGIRKDHAP